MKHYFQDKRGVASFVEEALANSKVGSPLIMIISRERYGVCSVSDVTSSVLAETALVLTQKLFEEWSNTLTENTQDG